MMLAILLFILCGAAGAVLGWLSPLLALSVLVGVLATTASLAWQIGLGNVATVLPYTVAMLGAAAVRRWLTADTGNNEPRLPRPLPALVVLAVSTVTVASLLYWVQARLAPPAVLLAQLRDVLRDGVVFNPPGPAGEVHAALIAVMGPLLLIFAAQTLRAPRSRETFLTALMAGAALVLLSPLVQFLLLNPWVRPDRGETEGPLSVGIVGFFQDQHSLAAYCLVVTCMAWAAAIGSLECAELKRAAGFFGVGAGALVLLLSTNSRGGLSATVLAVATLLVGWSIGGRSSPPAKWRTTGRLAVVGVLVVGLAVATATIASPVFRGAAHETLSKLGNERMWEPLERGTNPLEFIPLRIALYEKALILIQWRPLWGFGPNRFKGIPVEVVGLDGRQYSAGVLAESTHNYYLQLAAEYGIPVLICFLGLLCTIVGTIVRGAASVRDPAERALLWGVVAALTGIAAFSLLSSLLLFAELQVVVWSAAGLGIAIVQTRGSGSTMGLEPARD